MTQQERLATIGNLLAGIRTKKPLVHHITNYVTVNDCANITLAIGASPIMADDIGEAADITAISSALVLNIGTLNERTIESMLAAGKRANQQGIPVVLDPVGAGASELRNRTTQRILNEVKISVLRGNLSEIRFVAGLDSRTKGVDASEEDSKGGLQAGCETAQAVSKRFACVTAITGAVDIVTDGACTLYLHNGVPALSGVTGTGCMCSSLIGSFCGVTKDFLSAAAGGILSMSIAGELAAERAGELGSGSFRVALVDAISRMNDKILEERAKLDEA